MVKVATLAVLLLAGLAAAMVAEVPDVTEVTEVPDVPDVTEVPDLPEITEAPEDPEVTEAPEEPEVTERPVRPGTPVSIEERPSVAQIEKGLGFLWVQGCVGTILTSRHVLSVAHCFQYDTIAPRLTRIRVGSSERGRGGQIYHIDYVINHPDYRPESIDNNITILRLRSPIAFGTKVQQATIVTSGVVFPANLPVDVATWGRTTLDALWAEADLHNVRVFTVEKSTCVNQFASLDEPIIVTDNMMCTTVYDRAAPSPGFGDAGAPVFYSNILVGITGKNYGPSLPQITTAITAFTDWIVETAI